LQLGAQAQALPPLPPPGHCLDRGRLRPQDPFCAVLDGATDAEQVLASSAAGLLPAVHQHRQLPNGEVIEFRRLGAEQRLERRRRGWLLRPVVWFRCGRRATVGAGHSPLPLPVSGWSHCVGAPPLAFAPHPSLPPLPLRFFSKKEVPVPTEAEVALAMNAEVRRALSSPLSRALPCRPQTWPLSSSFSADSGHLAPPWTRRTRAWAWT
jgi:hypothetical protein